MVLEAIAKNLNVYNNNECVAVCGVAMEKLAARKQFFMREDALFRRAVSDVYEAKNDIYSCIQVLKDINYDGDCYEEKIDDWLSLAAYWFELKDPTAAESCLKKVLHIFHHTTDPAKIQRCRMVKAKVEDSNRDFLNAAQSYYGVSQLESVENQDLQELLDCALKCTLLSPAGPRKARLLAILYNDERLKSNQFYDLLAKMYLGSVIRQEHVEEFKNSLETYQNVTMADGYSVLEKALIEHNIVVISRIYMNIRFDELGNFLGIKKEQAEGFIAKMVEQARI